MASVYHPRIDARRAMHVQIVQITALDLDTYSVIRFTEQTYEILEAAESADRRGVSCPEWTLLITHEGAIRMIADSDWPLDSLAGEHGAQAAYRVIEDHQGLRVEARSGSRSCTIQSTTPRRAARLLLGQ